MWLSAVKRLVLLVALTNAQQAPGDESSICTDTDLQQVYPGNVRTLMDSYSYDALLPGNGTGNDPREGAVWNDRSFDDNDVVNTDNPTYWQQPSGGVCRYTARVCGHEEGNQDNWLFTQHIHKTVEPSLDNYAVQIRVSLTYIFKNCRTRLGCKLQFKVYLYKTNTIQLPSTSGSGFMNRDNYARIMTMGQTAVATSQTEVVTFELQPGETGFYLSFRDEGTCVDLSRVLVQRFECPSQQKGLVLYPAAPAPVSGSGAVDISCVTNGETAGSGTATCSSEGEWGPETPVCGCSPGYEVDMASNTECDICPEGEYQALVSPTEECKVCPGQSSANEEGTDVCKCVETYIRHLSRPDDACIRAPSAPRFDLDHVPVLDGTDISVVWLPSNNAGGEPGSLYYDVYAAQLDGDDPVFCRHNDAPIDNACNGDEQCSNKITGLDENKPYAILIVAANSATDDPECITNITILDCRYLVLVVGTEDAKSGLSAGAAAGVTFIVTLIFTAAATTAVIIVILYLINRRSSRYIPSGHSSKGAVTVDLNGKDDICTEDLKPTAPPVSWKQERSKPTAASRGPPLNRPVAPPPKPPAPKRPVPPSRPPHTESPHSHPHSHTH